MQDVHQNGHAGRRVAVGDVYHLARPGHYIGRTGVSDGEQFQMRDPPRIAVENGSGHELFRVVGSGDPVLAHTHAERRDRVVARKNARIAENGVKASSATDTGTGMSRVPRTDFAAIIPSQAQTPDVVQVNNSQPPPELYRSGLDSHPVRSCPDGFKCFF